MIKIVVTIDDDLQYDSADIAKLVTHYETTNHEIVYGIPKQKQQKWFHLMGSNIAWKVLFKMILNQERNHYIISSFRVFNKKMFEGFYTQTTDVDTMFNWYLAPKYIGYLEVNHNNRIVGTSGYTFMSKLNLYFEYITKYFQNPLKWYLVFSIIFPILFTSLTFILFFTQTILIQGLLIITLIVLLLVLHVLFLLGFFVIGYYVAHIYTKTLKKNEYFILEHHSYQNLI